MIELLPFTAKGASANQAEGFFFYDGPGTQVITINKGGSAAYETTPSIDGKTLVLSALTDRVVITLGTPINMAASDWTLEWSTINQTAEVAGYASELMLHTTPPEDSAVLIARYGDGGFGNRLQFGGRMATLATCYAVARTKANMVGVLRRFALVQKNGNISLFTNGVKENFAAGTSNTYDIPTWVNDATIQTLRRIVLGDWINGGSGAVPAKRGPMRLTMRALYEADYTPQPIG